jgi:hypothetical protein
MALLLAEAGAADNPRVLRQYLPKKVAIDEIRVSKCGQAFASVAPKLYTLPEIFRIFPCTGQT